MACANCTSELVCREHGCIAIPTLDRAFNKAADKFWTTDADEDMRCDSTLSAVALAVFAAVTLGCGLMLILAACGVFLT